MELILDYGVNYIAVIVSAILGGIVLGTLWYGPLFGKPWMKMMGFTQKDIDSSKKKGMTKYYVASLIASLISVYVLAVLIKSLDATTILAGMCVGFLVWIFIATVMLNSIIWEGKSVKLYLLNVSYQLVAYFIMGAILGVWQ